MGFWAKFNYGGRSAHYFKSENSFITLCGRMCLDGKIRVYEESKLKGNQCNICKKAINKIDDSK